MTPEEISKYVRMRCIEDGGCLRFYTKAKTAGRRRHPLVYIEGKQQLARRALYAAERGPIRVGYSLMPICGDECCLEPEHQKQLTLKQQSEAGSSKATHSPTRAAKVLESRRRLGLVKMTPELVLEVRQSDETGLALAERLGVDGKTISDIRLWKTWRHVGCNPFAGLVA